MKRIRPLIGSIGVVASLLVCGQVWAQEIGQPGAGRTFARQICTECHAIEKGQAFSPNLAAPPFEAIANIRGMTTTALSVALRSPHPTMPNVILNAEELSNVVAYILSLRQAN